MSKTEGTFFKRILKILSFILLGILVILIIIYVYLNTQSGKIFLTNKVQKFISTKINSKFTIEAIDFNLPNQFELNKVLLLDRNNDSILYAGQLKVDVSLFKLIYGETDIKKVLFQNAAINIHRVESDSLFNFQFVIDAFAGKKSKLDARPKDTAALNIHLKLLNFEHLSLHFDDAYTGTMMYAKVDTLKLKLDRFQPDKLQFSINDLVINGLVFTSNNTKKKMVEEQNDSTKNQLDLDAKNIDLKNIYIDIKDSLKGFRYTNIISSLNIIDATIQMATQKVNVKDIVLSNSLFTVNTNVSTAEKVKDTIRNGDWNVIVKNVSLVNNRFSLSTNKPSLKQGFDPNHIDLSELTLLANNIFYTRDSTQAEINNLSLKDKSGFQLDTLHSNIIYSQHQLAATDLLIKTPHSIIQNSIQLSFENLKTLTSLPYKTSLNLKLQNTVIGMKDVFTLMPSLYANERVQKMQHDQLRLNTYITGTLQHLTIPTFQIATNDGSYINANAKLNNIADPKSMYIDMHILRSSLMKDDLTKFIQLPIKQIAQLPPQLMIQSDIKGTLHDMATRLSISGKNVILDVAANIQNLDNTKALQYDADIKKLEVQKQFIFAFFPKEKLPKTIELPSNIKLSGIVKGDMNNVNTQLRMNGSYGKISVQGYVYNFKNTKESVYDLLINTNKFLLGKLLKQDTILNAITMSTRIKGKSFDIKLMHTDIKSSIVEIGYKQYNYQQLNINAFINNSALISSGTINDPNLRLSYNTSTNNIANPSKLNLLLQLDTARLQALHLMKDTFELSTTMEVNAQNLSPDNLNALLTVRSINIHSKNQTVHMDSMIVKAIKENEIQKLTMQSPFLQLNAQGKFSYNQLAPSLVQYVNRYYSFTEKKNSAIIPPQQIAISAVAYEHPLVKQFVNGLNNYDTIHIDANFNSGNNDSSLQVAIKAPFVFYTDKKIYNSAININSKENQLNVIVAIDRILSKDLKLNQSRITAIVMNDSIDINANSKNINGQDKYAIGSTIAVKDKHYFLHLKERLVLNNKVWSVAPNNLIYYSPQGFYIHNFKVGTNQSLVSIESEQSVVKSPINIQIKNFSIADITSLLNKDTMLASGIINGNVKLSDFEKKLPAFVGTLAINSVEVKQNKVGNLLLNTQKVDDNTISAALTLKENENDIAVNGNYFLNNDNKQFDATIVIKQFNINTIQGFTNSNIIPK